MYLGIADASNRDYLKMFYAHLGNLFLFFSFLKNYQVYIYPVYVYKVEGKEMFPICNFIWNTSLDNFSLILHIFRGNIYLEVRK